MLAVLLPWLTLLLLVPPPSPVCRKLFTAIQAGLLLTNESLQASHLEQTGEQLNYNSKIKGLLPEGLWKLWDPVAEEEATVVDLLVRAPALLTPRRDTSSCRAPSTYLSCSLLDRPTAPACRGTTSRASIARAASPRWCVPADLVAASPGASSGVSLPLVTPTADSRTPPP